MAAEVHVIGDFGTVNLPGVPHGEPLVGDLLLPAVADLLVEDAEFIADSVADGGNPERGQGIEETGRQPPEAAVAEPRLLLVVEEGFQVETELGDRLLHLPGDAEVEQGVPQVGAGEEFGGEVGDDLGLAPAGRDGPDPVFEQPVPHRVGQGRVPVVGRGMGGRPALHVVQVFDDGPGDRGGGRTGADILADRASASAASGDFSFIGQSCSNRFLAGGPDKPCVRFRPSWFRSG